MKATLEFKLPEERTDFRLALDGGDWWSVCFTLNDWLRNETKHPRQDMSEDTLKAYEECRAVLIEAINKAHLDLYL